MITINHSVKPSEIGGLGLFANEKVLKNQMVWKNNTDSEMILSESEKEELSEYMQKVFEFHGYFDKNALKWKLPLDNSRFMNHSNFPNTFIDVHGNSISNIDIEIGEEITCNYHDFDGTKRELYEI